MNNLTVLFIGIGLGALFVLVLKKDRPANDQQGKVDELAGKLDKSTDELSKAVSETKEVS